MNVMELENKMFYSMTGYGAGQATSKKMEVLCEIKSVNNRFIDISFRGYSLPNDLEEYIKNQIKKKFLRGSFEIKIHDNFQSEHSYELNLQSINNLKKTLKASKDFKHFFADHSLLMKKAAHDFPPLPRDDDDTDNDKRETTKACSMRQIPYNPKADLYDSDEDYTGSSVLQKRR